MFTFGLICLLFILAIIAEMLDPACSGTITLPAVSDLKAVRESLARTYDPPPGQKHWPQPNDSIGITGVGFFDIEHGRNDAAPNAIELHLVLAVKQIGKNDDSAIGLTLMGETGIVRRDTSAGLGLEKISGVLSQPL